MPDIHPDHEDGIYKPLQFLPVIYVLTTICFQWVIYMFCHVIPRLQLGVTTSLVQQPVRLHAQIECGIFNFLTAMLLLCYTLSTLTHPGEIPGDDPKWDYKSTPNPKIELKEKKKTGDRRHCKWCGKYKPDRTHHCRVCRMCILKMDHHCPWIYNCVGFYNYKYFFLLIMYSALACQFIFLTMHTSVWKAFWDDVDLLPMFLLVFGQTLSFFLTILLSSFWAFHVWLVSRSMTTIEFCEKNTVHKKEQDEAGWCCDSSYVESPYDIGAMRNFRNVLGKNPLFWLLPVWTVPGNGLSYETEETPVLGSARRGSSYDDLEDTRLVRKPVNSRR
jgi:hypothetical protein